jgi:hypothetical protein
LVYFRDELADGFLALSAHIGELDSLPCLIPPHHRPGPLYLLPGNRQAKDNRTASLNWNQNGTLKNLVIGDGFYSGNAQTCSFSYDDLSRLLTDNCGGTIWNQTFSYDQYDNVTTTGNPGLSWQPGYNSANNHYTLSGTTYDADGNLTSDGYLMYGYFADGRLQSADGWDCTIFTSTTGTCAIYDAFGRLAEVGQNGTYQEILYSPAGRVALMSGMTNVVKSYLPMPGGATVTEVGSAGATKYFWHKDWLGSVRMSSTISGRSVYFDRSFSPYGVVVTDFGNGVNSDPDFTGDLQDLVSGLQTLHGVCLVLFGGVRVPQNHLDSRVPQHCRQGDQIYARHGSPSREGVAQVIKPEWAQARAL